MITCVTVRNHTLYRDRKVTHTGCCNGPQERVQGQLPFKYTVGLLFTEITPKSQLRGQEMIQKEMDIMLRLCWSLI